MDKQFMQKCIELSRKALDKGDLPVGCVIVKNGEIIVKAENMALRNNDITDHAEILAMKEAQRILGKKDLSDCSIYTSMEPCPMCSFMIRELKFNKVVFGKTERTLGGYSKYGILQDPELEKLPRYFNPVPKIIPEFMLEDVDAVWQRREELKKQGIVK